MAMIGAKGGREISKDKEHMAKIGKKGGRISQASRKS
jgi:general stress protein YciG